VNVGIVTGVCVGVGVVVCVGVVVWVGVIEGVKIEGTVTGVGVKEGKMLGIENLGEVNTVFCVGVKVGFVVWVGVIEEVKIEGIFILGISIRLFGCVIPNLTLSPLGNLKKASGATFPPNAFLVFCAPVAKISAGNS